jgi:hypothetical protein
LLGADRGRNARGACACAVACGALFPRPLDKPHPLAARKAGTGFRTSRQNILASAGQEKWEPIFCPHARGKAVLVFAWRGLPYPPDLEANWIGLGDVAVFRVMALGRNDMIGERIVTSGPQRPTPVTIAALLSRVLSRPIGVHSLSPREFGALMDDVFKDVTDAAPTSMSMALPTSMSRTMDRSAPDVRDGAGAWSAAGRSDRF